MCNHCHDHEHELNTKNETKKKIIAAIVIFIAAMLFQPQGVLRFVVFFIAYMIAGSDVLSEAFKNILKGKIFDENFLMGIATLGAFAINEYPEAVMVMILFQIGEMFQSYAVEKSRKSITELMDIRPDYANIEQDGKLVSVPPEEIKPGDVIVIKTGEKVPLDGVVESGIALLDRSALTGEPVPVEVKPMSEVLSGSINLNGVLKIRVSKEFKESTVSKILELVENAGAKKAKTEKFITRFAKYYTPAVVLAALLLAVLPPILVEGAVFSEWLRRALTFLVISCPCALVISIPLSFFGGIGGASRAGILVKGSNYLEAIANPEFVVFDKTGTLTKGVFNVTQIKPAKGFNGYELLKYTALAESYSSHPIAHSLKKAYGTVTESKNVRGVNEISGAGIRAIVDDREVVTGNEKIMSKFGIVFEPVEKAGSIVYTAIDGRFAGYIVIADEIKKDAKQAVEGLKQLHAKVVMLTGDTESGATHFAKETGIDEVYSNLLPAQKVVKIEEFIKEKTPSKSVIFAGDGINDAPVLMRADVGIAMGGLGSDAAVEAADIVIMDDSPSKINFAIKIARKTMFIVKENIVFALGIKGLFLVLGAFGLVTMWGAVFADVGVSVLAILNSLRTLGVKEEQAR